MKKQFILSFIIIIISILDIKAQWVQTNGPYGSIINAIAVKDTNIFAGTISSGVYLSTNNGSDWNPINTGLSSNNILAFAISGPKIFISTAGYLYLSTNNGNSWTNINNGLPSYYLSSPNNYFYLTFIGTNLYVGSWQGIYKSTNNGSSWNEINFNSQLFYSGSNLSCMSIAIMDTNFYVGTSDYTGQGQGGIYTTEYVWLGQSGWYKVSDLYATSLAINNKNIFAWNFRGLYLSSDYGFNWNSINNGFKDSSAIKCLTFYGTNIFVGTSDNGVYLSTNNGSSWTAVNNGLTTSAVYSLTIHGTNMYAGTDNGVFIVSIPALLNTTAIQQPKKIDNTPNSFNLYQNYPNPFNPATTINYSVPKFSFVTIKVYDVMGKEIKTLVNVEKPNGNYKVEFDGSKLTSGIYFYRMQAGDFVETKKLILLK